MPKLIKSGAVQADADVCNNVEPPARGCHAGAGVHVDIPPDWQARILAGQQVPGCTYYALQQGDAMALDELDVSDIAVSRLATPAIVNALSAPLKAQAALLNIKLATAVVVQIADATALDAT